MRSQCQIPLSCWNPASERCQCGSTDTILVFILNIPSCPRAGSLWPEPNGLLALPNENQTLCCERVLRQETSIVYIFGIGTIELRSLCSSSCAQLPLHSCVDCSKGIRSSVPQFQIVCGNNSMSCNSSSVRVGETFRLASAWCYPRQASRVRFERNRLNHQGSPR
jgi:hypothetical protein